VRPEIAAFGQCPPRTGPASWRSLTGWVGSRTSNSKVWRRPWLQLAKLASSASTRRCDRESQGEMRAAAKAVRGCDGRAAWAGSDRRRSSTWTPHRPGGIARLPRRGMVQRVAPTFWANSASRRRPSTCPGIHHLPTTSGRVAPPCRRLPSTWSVKLGVVDRDIGVAATDVPDAMWSHPLGRHEGDLAWRLGMRDIEDADSRPVYWRPFRRSAGDPE